MIVKAILISIFVFILIRKYSELKGFTKEKILHIISLIYLIYSHSSCFQWLIWLIDHNDDFQSRFNISVGIIPAYINFYQILLYLCLSVIIIITLIGMFYLKDLSRRILIRVLPFVIPSSTISFYIGFKQQFQAFNDYIILFIGLIFYSAIYIGLCLLYRSKFMVELFKAKPAS